MAIDRDSSGYSGTPLVRKLGIKPGMTVVVNGAPDDFIDLLGPLPEGAKITSEAFPGADMLHIFTNRRDEMERLIADGRKLIKRTGAIWVSWYKKAAKLPTEITEDDIREAARALGLVDVKVCAVDSRWSGLKLVIRKENRI